MKIELPGHNRWVANPGHNRWLVIGDMFRSSIFGYSAELHFYMCDIKSNIKDIANLLEAYPSADQFFTGHMGSVNRESVVNLVKKLQEEYGEKNSTDK